MLEKIRPRRWSGLAIVALLGHLIWLAVFVYLFLVQRGAGVVVYYPDCSLCKTAAGVIATASQIDRFDFLGIGLTVLGLVIAVTAFGGFFLYRHAAVHAAYEETNSQMQVKGPEWVADIMRTDGARFVGDWLENNPGELRKAMSLAEAAGDESIDTDEMVGRMDEDAHGS